MGGARPPRHPHFAVERRSRGPGQSRRHAPRRCGAGHHEPARNHHRLGSRDRQARVECDRLAGPAHRADVLPPAQRRGRGNGPPENWAVARPILLSDEDRLDSRQRRRRARTRGERKAGLRNRRQLADLEPDRRRAPRHRPHQRIANSALQHRGRPLGRGASTDFRHSREHDARGCLVERRWSAA